MKNLKSLCKSILAVFSQKLIAYMGSAAEHPIQRLFEKSEHLLCIADLSYPLWHRTLPSRVLDTPIKSLMNVLTEIYKLLGAMK